MGCSLQIISPSPQKDKARRHLSRPTLIVQLYRACRGTVSCTAQNDRSLRFVAATLLEESFKPRALKLCKTHP